MLRIGVLSLLLRISEEVSMENITVTLLHVEFYVDFQPSLLCTVKVVIIHLRSHAFPLLLALVAEVSDTLKLLNI